MPFRRFLWSLLALALLASPAPAQTPGTMYWQCKQPTSGPPPTPAGYCPVNTTYPVPVTQTTAPSGATVVAPLPGNANGQASPVQGIGGPAAATQVTATLAGAAGKTTYICGYTASAGGATAGQLVAVVVSGLLSGGQTVEWAVPTGATADAIPLQQTYTPCLPASAVNTAIVVTVPSVGAGSTAQTVQAWGYQL